MDNKRLWAKFQIRLLTYTYLLYRPVLLDCTTWDWASLTMPLHYARPSAHLLQFSTASCWRFFATWSFHRSLGFLLFSLTSHLNTFLAGAPSSIQTIWPMQYLHVDALYYVNVGVELIQDAIQKFEYVSICGLSSGAICLKIQFDCLSLCHVVFNFYDIWM